MDSPPLYPTPRTPPKVRISNFRDVFLRKRWRASSPQARTTSEKKCNFDYFEYLEARKRKNITDMNDDSFSFRLREKNSNFSEKKSPKGRIIRKLIDFND